MSSIALAMIVACGNYSSPGRPSGGPSSASSNRSAGLADDDAAPDCPFPVEVVFYTWLPTRALTVDASTFER